MSKGTLQKISKEAMKVEWQGPSTSFQTPEKRRQIKKSKLDLITPGLIKTIRQMIYDFYLVEKTLPTLKGKNCEYALRFYICSQKSELKHAFIDIPHIFSNIY